MLIKANNYGDTLDDEALVEHLSSAVWVLEITNGKMNYDQLAEYLRIEGHPYRDRFITEAIQLLEEAFPGVWETERFIRPVILTIVK
jgi:hypothetical protein